jgi:hypothetical protein
MIRATPLREPAPALAAANKNHEICCVTTQFDATIEAQQDSEGRDGNSHLSPPKGTVNSKRQGPPDRSWMSAPAVLPGERPDA